MITDLRPRIPVAALVRVAALVLLAAAALAAGSCDKVPLTAPSNATIRLFANTPIVPLGGSAQITATVLQSGGVTVHNGTVVSFTTSLGTIEPVDAPTQDGKCTVTFRAGSQSGTATINAYSGAASTAGGTTAGGGTGGTTGGTTAPAAGSGVTLLVGAAAAASVNVTASPGTVPGAGGTSTITATVFDANNNLLPGVLVSFSTDVGSVSPASSTSDQTGQASTTLSTYQTATVTAVAATSGANQIKGTAKVAVNPPPTVTIAAPVTAPTVGIPTNFTVTVAPAAGGAPITRATITFVTSRNVVESTVNLGQPNGATTVAHTFLRDDNYRVTVTATDASGQTVEASVPVTVLAAQPFTLTVTAGNGRIGQAISITAIPTAGSGAPSVSSYTWDFGDGTPKVVTSGSQPVISHTYTSIPAGFTSWTYTVQVQATGSDGRLGFGSVNVTITP
jgi:adhesin/invasin